MQKAFYTLAGIANPETGWGIAGETWGFIEALGRLGGETWFRLGDRDLATHVERTRRLAAGETLSEVTDDLARRLGVALRVAPMSDDDVRTVVVTDEGELSFQHYFVRRRCEPAVRRLRYEGAAAARPSPALAEALGRPDLELVVICPSNPYLSVDPLLALPGVRERLAAHPAPVVAVSPIVGGAAIKGPAAKLMAEFGVEASAAAVARHYGALLDGFVIDRADAALAPGIVGPRVLVTETVMRTQSDRADLARRVLDFAGLR
jgi:LPPG:FO 2-phospho-L-lactate transferase